MNYALVVFEKPSKRSAQIQGGWPAFVDAIANAEQPIEKKHQLAEDSWLIPLQSATDTFAYIVSAARNFQIPHKVLYFSESPVEFSYQPPSP